MNEVLHPLDGVAHARIDEALLLVDAIQNLDLKEFHLAGSNTHVRAVIGEDKKLKRVVEVTVTLRSEI